MYVAVTPKTNGVIILHETPLLEVNRHHLFFSREIIHSPFLQPTAGGVSYTLTFTFKIHLKDGPRL